MKSYKALLVLLCCCLAEMQLRGDSVSDGDQKTLDAAQRTEAEATASSTQPTGQPDIHAMLKEMSALQTKFESLESRLTASERTVEEQRAVIKELKEKLEADTSALRKERAEVKVSFSASVRSYGYGFIGPFSNETPLVYGDVFTNVGSAYNPSTGKTVI